MSQSNYREQLNKDATATDAVIDQKVTKHGIGQYARHILLCTGASCSGGNGNDHPSWSLLKAKLIEKKLSPGVVFRTRCHCLRICAGGPIAVVYPEGTWYRGMTPEALEKVIDQHLVCGQPVEEYIFAKNPL